MNNGLLSFESMAKTLNDLTYTDYFIRLMLISRSLFEWTGLPDNMNEKWIERYLFAEGNCVFFKDPILGYMVTGLTPNGKLNYYNEPTTIRPYAYDYVGDTLVNDENCVVIKNNDMSIPTTRTIQLYAYKLAEIDRTISVNINAQKTPVIIECSEKERMSFRNFMKQRNDNEPQIFVTDKMNTEGITVHNLNTPMVFKDLEYQKHMVWNECMTFLGINNANMDKRERLVDDEVQANNEQVEACFNAMLSERQRACEMINKIFGLNVAVKKRIMNTPKLTDSEGSEEKIDDSELDYLKGRDSNG